MRDNELIRAFRPIIIEGLQVLNFGFVEIVQAYQPTQQGVNSTPTVYFYKVGDKHAGHAQRLNFYDIETDIINHVESQWVETTFQFQALVTQNPINFMSFTASDLINSVVMILQSNSAIDKLMENNIGIYKTMDLQNPYFVDDKDRYEYSPYFQGVFTHKLILNSTVPTVTDIKNGIYGV